MSDDRADEQVAQTNRLNRVLAEYLRRRETGQHVDMDALCAAHPDLADALRSYASGEGILEAMNQPVDQMEVESDASMGAETIRPGSGHRRDLIPDARFGRYRIIRLLGEGAMGAIYLAEDTTLNRQVALKIPKFSGREDDEFRQRFTREARAAAKLDHPNICRVYDAGDINGTPFITIEYIDGPTLSQLVGTEEYKDHRRIAEVVIGMAAGLAHAHAQGILHRDLKPGNVLLKSGTIPCVTDFGLARSVDTTEESRITHEGTILGTPAYMSPEQIDGKPELLGPSTDIYALGAVLYELLTERLPFEGSVMAILAKALHDPPKQLSKLCEKIDPALEDLCLQMLEKSSDRRPQSMQEVVNRLQQWLQKSSPEAKAATAKAQQTLDRLEGMKTKILDLIQRGQFAAAISGLEKMLDLKSSDATDYVAWAREQLPKVRKLPKQLKQAIPDLLDTAKQCMRAHDYTQAAQLLQEIPADYRSEQVQTHLDQATRLQNEADLLLTDLKKCVRTKQYLGIEDNLKRFLQLKPGNRFAKELHEALNTYSQVPQAQRIFRYDKQGKLQPLNEDNLLRSWILWSCVVGLLVFGGVSWGIMIYLKDGNQTLVVEINDDWLREQGGTLTLDIDGREHTISAGDMEVSVTFGDHGFSVRNGDAIVHNPQTFAIQKGETQILHIDASGLRLDSIASPPVPGSGENTGYAKRSLDPDTEIFHLKGTDERVRVMRSAGDRLFACTNKHAFVYSMSLANEIARIPLTNGTNGITCNAGGTKLAVSSGNSVQVWDVSNQKKEFSVVVPEPDAVFLRLAADDEMNFVLGAVAKTHLYKKASASLYLINCQEQSVKKVFELDENGMNQVEVEYHPSRNLFYASRQTGTEMRNIYEIDPKSGKTTSHPFNGDGHGSLACVPGTDLLAVATWSGETQLLNTRTWNQDASLRAVDRKYDHFVIASRDGSYLATSTHEHDGNNRILVTRVSDRRELFDIPADGIREPSKMAFSGDSQYLAFAGEPSKNNTADDRFDIRVARLGMNETLSDLLSDMPIESTVVDALRTPLPDGPPGLVKSFEVHQGATNAVAWSSDGRTLVTTSSIDGFTRVWDVESKAKRYQFKSAFGYGLAMHPNGKYVAAASPWHPEHHSISIFDVNSGMKVAETPGFMKPWLSGEFSPDGKYLAIHCRENEGIKIYDVSSLPDVRVAAELRGGDSGWMVSLAFLPGGKQLLAGSAGEKYGLRLFDIASKRELRSYRERKGELSSNIMDAIAVHPSGKQFHVVSNGTWRLTKLNVAEENTAAVLGKDIRTVVYSPSGEYLIGISHTEAGANSLFSLSAETGLSRWHEGITNLDPTELAISPDGRFVAVSGYIADVNGELQREAPCPLQIWRLPK